MRLLREAELGVNTENPECLLWRVSSTHSKTRQSNTQSSDIVFLLIHLSKL
ncbi:MAG: hypothetical protein ACJAY7_000168 [Pseudohongiellaceae bacterium]|jgi:hypothetical protein